MRLFWSSNRGSPRKIILKKNVKIVCRLKVQDCFTGTSRQSGLVRSLAIIISRDGIQCWLLTIINYKNGLLIPLGPQKKKIKEKAKDRFISRIKHQIGKLTSFPLIKSTICYLFNLLLAHKMF